MQAAKQFNLDLPSSLLQTHFVHYDTKRRQSITSATHANSQTSPSHALTTYTPDTRGLINDSQAREFRHCVMFDVGPIKVVIFSAPLFIQTLSTCKLQSNLILTFHNRSFNSFRSL